MTINWGNLDDSPSCQDAFCDDQHDSASQRDSDGTIPCWHAPLDDIDQTDACYDDHAAWATEQLDPIDHDLAD